MAPHRQTTGSFSIRATLAAIAGAGAILLRLAASAGADNTVQHPQGMTRAGASGMVERSGACGSKIFVRTDVGYAMLERLAGGVVVPGDHVSGDWDHSGRATLRDRENGSIVIVFVDDHRMSRAQALSRMAQSCHEGR